MGAVIHGDERERRASREESLVEHCGDDTHRAGHLRGAVFDVGAHEPVVVTVLIAEGIALFRDRECHHLQALCGEDLFQPVPLRLVGDLCFHGFAEDADHFLLHCAIAVQVDAQREVVVRAVDPVHDVIVERLDAGDAAVHPALLRQPVGDAADENAENVADAEMHPYRSRDRAFRQRVHVVRREPDACLFEGLPVPDPFSCQFHDFPPMFCGCYCIPSHFI